MATATPIAPALSPADVAAHAAASYVRSPRTVLHRVSAGNPRGSRPAEEFAAQRREEGVPAEVVYDYPSDAFLVITRAVSS
ncbi:hypothetical protein ABZ791_30255 [Streptomyces huasconensis]|uniref:Uncharacterized protein n=1 Tax=Streptomyces huasconensis TaxID=1854574 RepID=A0ABV3M1M4_9ACTN